jgi:hypothetical protein
MRIPDNPIKLSECIIAMMGQNTLSSSGVNMRVDTDLNLFITVCPVKVDNNPWCS